MSHAQVIEAYGDLWQRRDPEAIAAHFTSDGVRRWEFVVPPLLDQPNSRQGPAEIVIPVRGLLTAIPELSLEVLTLVETEAGGIIEWRHAGRHTGAWDRWTPQGEWVEFTGVSVYRVAGDSIQEETIYFDPDQLIRNWAVPLGTLAGIGMGMMRRAREIRRARRLAA